MDERVCRKRVEYTLVGRTSEEQAAALFRGRRFQDEIIVLCLRWYLRYSLSHRDLEEMMAERRLSLDHSTIAGFYAGLNP